MQKLKKPLIYFIALNLIVLGIDKFFTFIPEACTLMVDAPNSFMYTFGVLELVMALFLLLGKYTRTILVLIILMMVWAIGMHLWKGTYDIGGAIFLGIVAAIPLFIKDDSL